MSPRSITTLLVAAAVLLWSVPPREAVGADRCYGEWSDAAPIVAREKLRSARDVQDMARNDLAGDVVRIMLCEGDSGFVYRLVLRRNDGRIGTLIVNARGGSPR